MYGKPNPPEPTEGRGCLYHQTVLGDLSYRKRSSKAPGNGHKQKVFFQWENKSHQGVPGMYMQKCMYSI